jgi:hypothetical protein
VAYSVTLDSLGRSYSIPEAGATNWTNQTSLYLRDLSTVINSISSGSLATPVYNVRNYGATGNGTTDDTNAIRSAMAALALRGNSGGTLYFPAGTYKVTSVLQFGVAAAQRNVKITGDGVSSVVLQFGAFATTPLFEFRDCDYWGVSNIKLDGSNNAGTRDIVLVDGSSYGVLTACTVTGAQRYGVNISQVSGSGLPAYNAVDGNVLSANATANVFVQEATTGNVVNQVSGTLLGRDYVNVKDFGAKGDGVTDDTAAIQAAFNACVSAGLKGKTCCLPAGDYVVTNTLTIPSNQGFHLVGNGPYASRLLWSGSAGDNVINVSASQFCVFEKFTVWGNAASRPNAAFFMAAPGSPTFAPGSYVFRDLLVDGTAAADVVDYGIYWEDTYGNNSEVNYYAVTLNKTKEAAIILPGTQQKSHNMYGVQMGVGKIGVRCGGGIATPDAGGAFQWYGGGAGSFTQAAFSIEYPNDAIVIDGCQSEHCYRFLDMGATQSAGRQPITIRGCRLDCALTTPTPAYSSWIRLAGLGPFLIQGNIISGGSSGVTLIQINAGGQQPRLTVRDNEFHSDASVSVSPINNNSVFQVSLELENNTYATAANSYASRLEPLDAGADTPTLLPVQGSTGYGSYSFFLSYASLTAAATSQVIPVVTLPKGVRVQGAYFYVHNRYQKGGAALTLQLGSTSGGSELLLPVTVSEIATTLYGDQPSHVGALVSARPRGGIPAYFATTPLYLKVISASGNLGNGSVTNLSDGTGVLILELETMSRWLGSF